VTPAASPGRQWKLATIRRGGSQQAALVLGDGLFAIEGHAAQALLGGGGPPTMLSILERWSDWQPVLNELAAGLAAPPTESGARALQADVSLQAPVLYPRKVLCAGANYGSHVREMGREPPDKARTRPFFFLKPPTTTIIGPDEPIRIPPGSDKVDWEVELAAIIGRTAQRVPRERAAEYVAGYTILNDISARDLHRREDWGEGPFYWDWLQSKGCDTFAPMGPYLVPRSQIGDPYNLRISLSVNGETMQDSNTSDLIFNVEEQIAYLSSMITLEPGDVIATGTPPGVGMPRGIFLEPGDVVVAEIERIGALRNPVIGSEASGQRVS